MFSISSLQPLLFFLWLAATTVGCKNVALQKNGTTVFFPPHRVTVNGKVGYINPAGDVCIPANFYYGSQFDQGFAIVQLEKNSHPFVIDEKGREFCKFPPLEKHENPVFFHHPQTNMLIFGIGCGLSTKICFVSTESNAEDICLIYENVLFYREGLAAVKKNDQFGFIDERGELVIDCMFDNAWSFRQGLAAVKKNGNWGYIKRDGNWAIEPTYFLAYPFSEGVASVRIKEEDNITLEIIDAQGQPVLEDKARLDRIKGFGASSEGLCDFSDSRTGKIGYMDHHGNIVIPAVTFSDGGPFLYGLAAVSVEKKGKEYWGIIDRRGHFVVEPKYYYIQALEDFPAYIVEETEDSDDEIYSDLRGKVIWPPKRRGESL